MVILSLTEKGGETKQLQFDKNEVGIGRVQGNEIVLPKGNVSKRHCRIFIHDGKFSVEDLKSTNGTYVNGRKLTEATEVFSGDKIYVGDFIVRVENAPTAEAANLGTEAGSLSTALGTRRPPPPPGGRPTGAMAAVDDAGRGAPPPPPPPPAPSSRRDTMVPPPGDAPIFALPAPPPSPPAPPAAPARAATVLDLDDDEPLATAPPRAPTPPPMRPAPPPAAAPPPPPAPAPPIAVGPPEGDDDMRERALSDAVTATKKKGAVAPNRFDNPANPAAWLSTLLGDAAVSAVYVMGPEAVAIDRNGKREDVALGQAEAKSLLLTLKTLVERSGASIDVGVVDLPIEGGARLVAIFPPYSRLVCATITRSASIETDLSGLQNTGELSGDVKAVLQAALATGCNILVSGDRSPGLALLRALAKELSPASRVVSIGELVASSDPESPWVTLATEPRNADLIHAAAHLHAEHLFADITAAAIAADVLHECAFGQQGSVVLCAGRSTRDALARLEAATGASFRSASAAKLLATAFDVVVHVNTLVKGGWRVSAVAEPTVTADGRIDAVDLIVYEVKGASGAFKATGASSRLAKTLEARGKAVPNEVLKR